MVIMDEQTGRSFRLTEGVVRDLTRFVDELDLDPPSTNEEISVIVSTLLAEQLRLNRQAWLDVFRRSLRS